MIWKKVVRTNIACTNVTVNLLKMVPGSYLYSLVKIGSVSADIFLIWTYVAWTNVAWTNVAWTNITVTIGIS